MNLGYCLCCIHVVFVIKTTYWFRPYKDVSIFCTFCLSVNIDALFTSPNGSLLPLFLPFTKDIVCQKKHNDT